MTTGALQSHVFMSLQSRLVAVAVSDCLKVAGVGEYPSWFLTSSLGKMNGVFESPKGTRNNQQAFWYWYNYRSFCEYLGTMDPSVGREWILSSYYKTSLWAPFEGIQCVSCCWHELISCIKSHTQMSNGLHWKKWTVKPMFSHHS